MRHILSIPILAPVILLFVFVNFAKDNLGTWLDTESTLVEGLVLPSGTEFFLTIGNVLVVMALCGFFLKIVRASRYGANSLFDRIVSTLTFFTALGLFLFVGACGSASFFALLAMALVDMGVGFISRGSTNDGFASDKIGG